MKQIFIMILMFTLIVSVVQTGRAASSVKLNQLSYSAPEVIAQPCQASTVSGCDFTVDEAGDLIFYGVFTARPAVLVAYNVDKRQTIDTQQLTHISNAPACDVGPDGRVYITGNGHFYIYDPKTKTIRHMADTSADGVNMNRGTFDGEGNYYFGTSLNACLYQYHVESDEVVLIGRNMVKGQYVRAAVGYKNKVFIAALGVPNNADLKVYDTITKKTRDVVKLPEHMGKTAEDNTTFYTISRLNDRYAAFKAATYGYTQYVLDMEEEKWVDVFNGGNHMHLSPLDGDVTYFGQSQSFGQRNIKTHETVMYDDIIWPENISFYGPVVHALKDQENYPGKSVLAGGGDGVFLINLEKRSIEKIIDQAFPTEAAGMRTICAGYNGDIICSAMHGGAYVYTYNTYDGSVLRDPLGQVEEVVDIDGKYYLGAYAADTGIYEYDRTGAERRPVLVSTMKDAEIEQGRTFTIVDIGDKILYGSVPHYGNTTGAVATYDKTTKETRIYENIVPNHSVTGLAYRDGKIYGSTTIYAAYGLEDNFADEPAKVFRMDLETGNVETVQDVILKTDRARQYFAGHMTFSEDGRLFLGTNNTLVELNPEDMSIKAEIPMGSNPSMTRDVNSMRWQGFAFAWTPNGLLLTNIGGAINAVDIDTMKHLTILESGCTQPITLGADGNLYYPSGVNVMKITLTGISGDREDFLKRNAMLLKIGSPNVLYFGHKKTIDADNESIVPQMKGGKIMAPVRYLAEAFRADVKWDQKTQTVLLTRGFTQASIKLGEKKMVVDGEEIMLDAAAEIIDDRTMVPLNAFIEGFLQRKVHYDAVNKLIVISNENVTIETADRKVLRKLSSLLDGGF